LPVGDLNVARRGVSEMRDALALLSFYISPSLFLRAP
jgi:hypothetical protein